MSAVRVSTTSLLGASLCLTPKALFHSISPRVQVLSNPPLLRDISQFLTWTDLVFATEPLVLDAYFIRQEKTIQTLKQLFRERIPLGLKQGERELEANNFRGEGSRLLNYLRNTAELSGSPNSTTSQRLDSFLSIARLSSSIAAQQLGNYASCLVHILVVEGSLSVFEELLFFPPFYEFAALCVQKSAIALVKRAIEKGELIPFMDLLLRHSLLTPPLIEEIVKWTIDERVAGNVRSCPDLSHFLLDQRLYPPLSIDRSARSGGDLSG